jgi:hypothetical protein
MQHCLREEVSEVRTFVGKTCLLSFIFCPQCGISQQWLSELLTLFWENHFPIHRAMSSTMPSLGIIIHSMTFLKVWIIQARLSSQGPSTRQCKVNTRLQSKPLSWFLYSTSAPVGNSQLSKSIFTQTCVFLKDKGTFQRGKETFT